MDEIMGAKATRSRGFSLFRFPPRALIGFAEQPIRGMLFTGGRFRKGRLATVFFYV